MSSVGWARTAGTAIPLTGNHDHGGLGTMTIMALTDDPTGCLPGTVIFVVTLS